MSNFSFKAKNKKTEEQVAVNAFDDYFGKHQYGYRVENIDRIFDEFDFDENFEMKVYKINLM